MHGVFYNERKFVSFSLAQTSLIQLFEKINIIINYQYSYIIININFLQSAGSSVVQRVGNNNSI